MIELVKRYEDRYGKLAFGTVTLLILWVSILKPMQDRMVVHAHETATATSALLELAHSLERSLNTSQARGNQ